MRTCNTSRTKSDSFTPIHIKMVLNFAVQFDLQFQAKREQRIDIETTLRRLGFKLQYGVDGQNVLYLVKQVTIQEAALIGSVLNKLNVAV